MFRLVRNMVVRSIERDRSLEGGLEVLSRLLWPWRDTLLVALVGLLALLDYTSTYAFLELSGNQYVYESGPLASWALEAGGLTGLLFFDLVAASTLSIMAITIRSLHFKLGFPGYGRTAFVVLLVPYVVITMAAIFNNVVITFIQ